MATEESVSKRAGILLRKSQMKIFSDAIRALKESPLQVMRIRHPNAALLKKNYQLQRNFFHLSGYQTRKNRFNK